MPTPEPRYNPDDEGLPLCVDCDRETAQTDPWSGEPVCPSCADERSQAAWERQQARYHGGSGPQTDAERMDAAYRQKREGR